MQKQDLIKYLCKLGLTTEEAQIYVALSTQGTCTPLLLSRLTGINRTKVYRTVESLREKRLVAEEIEENTTRYSPAPTARIQEILKDKQVGVAELAREYVEIENSLGELSAKASSDTKVRFYRGIEGIRQMVWNVLKAKSEIVGYTTRDLTDYVGEKFMREFVEEFVRRNLHMRDIFSDEYVKSKKTQLDWGGRAPSRYLPGKVLSIPHQMDIYDEVVTFYEYQGGEVWGTEIYNAKVARVQKQLFEIAWERAKKI